MRTFARLHDPLWGRACRIGWSRGPSFKALRSSIGYRENEIRYLAYEEHAHHKKASSQQSRENRFKTFLLNMQKAFTMLCCKFVQYSELWRESLRA